MKYIVTIYSPDDKQEQVNYISEDRDKRIAAMALLMDAMEPGAWFKVERSE